MKEHLYLKVYQQVRNNILTGKYKTGEFLPSENEMSAEYQTTRATIRQALEKLVNEGYIVKQKGKGSIVQSERQTLGLLSFKGFSEVVSESQHEVKTIFLQKPVIQPFPADFFYKLSKTETEQGCIYLERLRLADKDPVMQEYTFVPNQNLNQLTEKSLITDSLFKTLSLDFQIDIIGLEQQIRAISATEAVANLLQLKKNSPVLHIYRKYLTNRKDFFIYSSLYCNTEKYGVSG